MFHNATDREDCKAAGKQGVAMQGSTLDKPSVDIAVVPGQPEEVLEVGEVDVVDLEALETPSTIPEAWLG